MTEETTKIHQHTEETAAQPCASLTSYLTGSRTASVQLTATPRNGARRRKTMTRTANGASAEKVQMFILIFVPSNQQRRKINEEGVSFSPAVVI